MPRLAREVISTTGSGPTMKDSKANRNKVNSFHRTGLLRPRDEVVEVLAAIGWEAAVMRKVVNSSRPTAPVDSRV